MAEVKITTPTITSEQVTEILAGKDEAFKKRFIKKQKEKGLKGAIRSLLKKTKVKVVSATEKIKRVIKKKFTKKK